jgi:hypothetical protein
MKPHAGSNLRNLELNRESFAENVEAKSIIEFSDHKPGNKSGFEKNHPFLFSLFRIWCLKQIKFVVDLETEINEHS